MGKITAYCKIGCPHSEATAKTLIEFIRPKLNQLSDIDRSKNSIEIIWIEKSGDSINKIGDQNVNMSKSSFFSSLFSKYGLEEIRSHSTFPLILYTTSEDEQYYIGGNDNFQNILSRSSSIESEEDCRNQFKTMNEGNKRLFCHLLVLLNKTKNIR